MKLSERMREAWTKGSLTHTTHFEWAEEVAQLEAEIERLREFLGKELWQFIDDEMPTFGKDTTMLEMIERILA